MLFGLVSLVGIFTARVASDSAVVTILLPIALSVLCIIIAQLMWLGRRTGHWMSAVTSGIFCAVAAYFWVATGWDSAALRSAALAALPLGVSIAVLVISPSLNPLATDARDSDSDSAAPHTGEGSLGKRTS